MIMDRTDEEILYYLEHGRTNAYQVWAAMKKESNDHMMAYNNLWRRFQHLKHNGIIEQIEIDEINIHARKDYRIAKEGRKAIRKHIQKLEDILK